MLRSRFLLPALFLLLVGPTVLIQVFLTPPIQVSDEENHLLRASQLMNGQLFGHRISGGAAGGFVDPLLPMFAHTFDTMRGPLGPKADPSVYAAASTMRWRSGPRAPYDFANTAIYPFFLYLPASSGLALGRAAHLKIMDSFYLARLFTALASLALGAAALLICRHGVALLFLILSLPMTTSLFASVSQDAMSIALGALGAALWSSHVGRGRAMTPAARALTALMLGTVIAARLPFAPLYVLALMPTRQPERIGWPRSVDAAAALAGLVPIAFGLYGAHVAKVPFRLEDGVSAAAQLAWIAAHPLAAARIGMATIHHDLGRLVHEFVGMLGWLDTSMPEVLHRAMWVCALLAAVLDRLTLRTRLDAWAWLPILAIGSVVVAIFGALYLAYTPVGAPLIEGVQGRYFLVPAIVLAVSLPGWRPSRWRDASDRVDATIHALRAALCVFAPAIDLWHVPVALIHRYYG